MFLLKGVLFLFDQVYIRFGGICWHSHYHHTHLLIEANHSAWGQQIINGNIAITSAVRGFAFCTSVFYTVGENFYIDGVLVVYTSLTSVEKFYNNLAIKANDVHDYTIRFLLTGITLRLQFYTGINIWNLYLTVPVNLPGIRGGLCHTGVCSAVPPTLPATLFGGLITREQATRACIALLGEDQLNACILDIIILGDLSFAELALKANEILQTHEDLYHRLISAAPHFGISPVLFPLILLLLMIIW